MDDNFGANPTCPVHLIPYEIGGPYHRPCWICPECDVPVLQLRELKW